jgi:endonuclease/exonuclease/phosphatase (EEP) superfamily protein YafD
VSTSGEQRRSATARALTRLAALLALLSVTVLVLGMLGHLFWPFDLFAHFRVHCAAVLIACALMLLAAREWRSGVIAALAATLAASPLFDYLAPASPPALSLEAGPSFRALSINTWFRNEDTNRLVGYLEASGADVIVLQEISADQGRGLHARLKAYPYAYVEGAAESDAVLLSRWPIADAGLFRLAANGVSAIRATINWRGTPITLVGAHLHWPIGPHSSARRNAELAGLALLAHSHSGPLIMLGDLNITPWSPHFQTLLGASGLRDCAIGHGLDPTWPSQVLPLGIRIDHCLASKHWRSMDTQVGPAVGSDHRPMMAELQLTK